MGFTDRETVQRVALLIEDFRLKPEHRAVVEPARRAAVEAQEQGKGNEGIYCGAAIALKDGTMVTGSNSPLMHAASSVVIHAIKHMAGIPEKIKLLPPGIQRNGLDSLLDVAFWNHRVLGLSSMKERTRCLPVKCPRVT